MPQVSVPDEFFRAELRVYGDWREALARELLQNALDAKPAQITIVTSTEGGHGRLVFTDDGCGMTRRVLEEVFFALGKTTKNSETDIGGFGRARMIICFGQTSYQIRTGNALVRGHGGEYTITETDEHMRGCEFSIELLDEDHERVLAAFQRVLNTCHLAVPVYLNGNRAGQRPMPSRATRVLRDDDGREWGKVYVSDYGSGRLLARVHGLTMFSRWLPGFNDTVILELAPSRAREVLSASRDNLHTVYARQLDEFVTQLTQNRRKALRPPTPPLDVHIGGGGFLVTDADIAADVTDEEPAARDTAEDSESKSGGVVRVTPANEAAFLNFAAAHQTDAFRDALDVDPAPDTTLGFDVYMMADAADSRVRRLTRTWDPTGWDGRTGARRKALLMAWKAAVAVCLDTLVKQHPSVGRIMWTVGWTFDEGVQALHRTLGNGHVFALNPVTSTGARKFQVSSKQSRRQLAAIAAHEVCHVLRDDHDESFAGQLTDLFGILDVSAVDRAIREAASRV